MHTQHNAVEAISKPALKYWNVNVPVDQQTAECPPYLRNLSVKDEQQLATPDAVYKPLDWPQVRSIILDNRLQDFTRLPSDLRRYRAFVYDLVQRYGTVSRYVLEERLQWRAEDLDAARGRRMFESPSDYKILRNDWPYGLDKRIEHLVIWTKFELKDAEDGDLADETRRAIERFMERTLYGHVPRKNVIWFKNWSAIKSVHAVEHFHIMLFDVDTAFVDTLIKNNGV